MILKIGKNKLLYVIYMMFILNVNYSVFNTSHKYIFSGILFLWCLLLVLANIIRNHYDYVFWSGVEGFVIPMIAVTMLSTLSAILIYHTPVRGDYTQSIIRALHYCEAYTIAYFSYKWFGKDCIRLYIVSGLISYSTTVIRFFAYGGIDAFTHLFNTKFNDVTLEVHNLTYILGLFFLYYITSSDYSKKTKKNICLILAVAIFLGNKRALYLGMAVSALTYYLFHKFDGKRIKLLKFLLLVYIIVAFGYIFMIKYGVFEAIMTMLNIKTNSRLIFWNYFNPIYELSPSYLGRGLAYTSNVMNTELFLRSNRISSGTELHNDILRAYIGWGFMPFVCYFFNFIYLQTSKIIKQKGKNIGWKFFSIMSCVFFIYFFDNMLDNIDFNIAFFMIWVVYMKTDLITKNMNMVHSTGEVI